MINYTSYNVTLHSLVYFHPSNFKGFLLLLIKLFNHQLDFWLVILEQELLINNKHLGIKILKWISGTTSIMFFLDIKSLYSSSAFSNMAMTFLFTLFSRLQQEETKCQNLSILLLWLLIKVVTGATMVI